MGFKARNRKSIVELLRIFSMILFFWLYASYISMNISPLFNYWFNTESRSVFLLCSSCLIMCFVLFDKVRIWACSLYDNMFKGKVSYFYDTSN